MLAREELTSLMLEKTKGEDFYLTLTESTRKFNGDGYERHKIFLYKEDFNRFLTSLEDVIEYVKTELMPDYDYDEYTRRHEEYEANREEMDYEPASTTTTTTTQENDTVIDSEDDMSW